MGTPAITSKLPSVGTTIFTVMSGLAAETGAINLSQGFPGFPVHEALIDLVNRAMHDGHNQYAPMPGILALRERIAEKMEELYGHRYDPNDEITVTAGGTQALFSAITAVVQPGDEVIVLEPAYDSYIPAIQLAGGIPVPVALHAPDFRPDWNEVRSKCTARTRLIMINTPQNPTGMVFSAEDIQALISITTDTGILILSDEVYEHILFDGQSHLSVASYPELAERSLVVFSFGKTYHATGWKCGYVLAPATLMREFRKVHQFTVFSVNTPLQYALAVYMQERSHYSGLPALYQAKRDLFRKLLASSRFRILPCHGSYFQLLDYSEITEVADTEFAKQLTRSHGVASIPVSVFYTTPPASQRLLRFCFAKEDYMLEAAAERLCAV
ncbi:MAG: methionine aminotransferase [Bacteroidota bacterium]